MQEAEAGRQEGGKNSKEKSRGNYPSKEEDFGVNPRMLRLMKCTELALN